MVGNSRDTVMAAIDANHEFERLIIADVTTDDSWLSILEPAAVSLKDWR
jgi:hypothetical protein